jgi:hypothetical protein
MRRTANAARRPTPSDASPRAAAPAVPPSARILPTAAEFLDPRGPYLVPLVLLLAFRIVAWQTIPLPAEDAFITFRYARNLATGNGLVYNPGEWVMGFSSPSWTLWISLGYALTHDAVLWARISGIVADVATLLVAGRMIVTAASPAAAWCFTFFFAAWPYFPALAVSGMEMSLLILAITFAAALAVARHPAAGPSLALLALTRPEGLVAAAVIALAATNRDRIVGLVLTGAGLAALASRYGSPIPQSVVAKSHVYGLAGPWLGRHWWEWLSPIVMGRWPKVGDTAPLMVMTLVFAPALALGVRPLWAARRSALAIACAAAVTIWLGYAVLGVAYFWWYLAVPLTAATWIAAVGFPRLARGPALPAVVAAFVLSVHSLAYRSTSALAGGTALLRRCRLVPRRARASRRARVPRADRHGRLQRTGRGAGRSRIGDAARRPAPHAGAGLVRRRRHHRAAGVDRRARGRDAERRGLRRRRRAVSRRGGARPRDGRLQHRVPRGERHR